MALESAWIFRWGGTRRGLPAKDAPLLLIVAFIVLPMLVAAVGVFRPSGEAWRHLRSTVLSGYIFDTIVLTAAVGLLATMLGTLLAWFTVNYTFPGSRFFSWALGLPIALPAYISAFTYAHVLGITGPVFRSLRAVFGADAAAAMLPEIMSLAGCIFVLTFSLYPYVYYTARSFFSGSSSHYVETARSCGRGDAAVFFRIAVPISRPAIVAGGSLVVMETLNEYGATSYYGVNTMVTGIFRAWFAMGDVSSALRLSGFFLIGTVIILALEKLQRGRRRYHETKPRPIRAVRPRRISGFIMCGVCAFSFGFGLAVPTLQLLFWAVGAFSGPRAVALAAATVRSVLLSAGTGLICLAVSLFLLYLVRGRSTRAANSALEISASGYAVPGAIIAVGVLYLARFVNDHTSLFLFGTLGVLVYAYVVRFLAITIKPLRAGLAKVPMSFDDAGALTGRSRLYTFLRVHTPLLRSAAVSSLIIVCIDLLKELPMTLVLRPFNFDTLAALAYEYALQDRLPEASLPSLMIVAAGVSAAMLLMKQQRNITGGPYRVSEHK